MSDASDLLIVEDLFLLMHDAESGKPTVSMAPDAALAGALLLDLAEQQLVGADASGALVPATGTSGTAAPEHPLLARALTVLAENPKPRDAGHWVTALPRALKPFDATIGHSLVERGVLTEQRYKMLGLFAAVKWPERDPEPERRLRAGLADVLARGTEPTARQELLIPLLYALNYVPSLVEKPERSAALARAKEFAAAAKDGALVSAAVSQSVTAVQTAVLLAILTPVIVGTVVN